MTEYTKEEVAQFNRDAAYMKKHKLVFMIGHAPKESAMRTEFITCKSHSTAKRRAPWAAVIARVEGGYMAFESLDDYRVWRGQR